MVRVVGYSFSSLRHAMFVHGPRHLPETGIALGYRHRHRVSPTLFLSPSEIEPGPVTWFARRVRQHHTWNHATDAGCQPKDSEPQYNT